MHTAHPRPLFPSRWHAAALVYTVGGAVCLLACIAAPESEAAMVLAILGGLPWSLGLLSLDLAPGVAQTALLVLAGGWAVNASVLWWIALRRRGTRVPSGAANRSR